MKNVPATSAGTPAAAASAGAGSFTPVLLPGGSRGGIGFDDLTFANRLHRVLAPAGRTGKLDLVDPSTREIAPVDGFAAVEEQARGHEQGTTSADEGGEWIFAIDRTTQRLDVVDPKQRKIVGAAPLGGSPDYVRWVEATREVWVTEPDSEKIEVFSVGAGNPPKPEHAAYIEIKDGPESLVIDKKRQRAFTHLWKSTTLAIDLHTRAIVGKWRNGCAGSRGIALDEARGFLFAGCAEGKAVALAIDHDGKLVGTIDSGKGVDVIAYSPSLMHLYVPGAASATLAVIGVAQTGELTALASVPTAEGAHCVTADDRGGAWVCDPQEGRLLFLKDDFAPRTK